MQGWMGVEPYCDEDPNADPILEVETTSKDNEDDFEECENDHGCEYKCKMNNEEPTCICQSGYVIEDVTTCVDIDECLDNNGGCQYNCINKPGTFQCK